jgi:hypothetical protein
VTGVGSPNLSRKTLISKNPEICPVSYPKIKPPIATKIVMTTVRRVMPIEKTPAFWPFSGSWTWLWFSVVTGPVGVAGMSIELAVEGTAVVVVLSSAWRLLPKLNLAMAVVGVKIDEGEEQQERRICEVGRGEEKKRGQEIICLTLTSMAGTSRCQLTRAWSFAGDPMASDGSHT